MSDAKVSGPTVRWRSLCLDCADADELAAFYSRLLGWEIGSRGMPGSETGEAGWVNMRNPPGSMGLRFQAESWYEPPAWPEEPGKQAKMMHFEICVDDVQAAVALAIEAGGRLAPYQPEDHAPDELRVVLDPAGHPFCLFVEGQ